MSNPKIQGQRTATDGSQMTRRELIAKSEQGKGIGIREGEKSEEKGKGEQEIVIDSEEWYIEVDFWFVFIVTVKIPLIHLSTITG